MGMGQCASYAGETLNEGRRNPIFDACRTLLARDMTGQLEVWRRGKASADMQLDIERGQGGTSADMAVRFSAEVPMGVLIRRHHLVVQRAGYGLPHPFLPPERAALT